MLMRSPISKCTNFSGVQFIYKKTNNGGDFMAKNHSCKTTSSRVASKASSILRDGRTSTKSKSVAGSALSQKTSKKK